LSALLPPESAAGDVAVHPCVGAPVPLSVETLRANPGRYFLVMNARGALMLVDRSLPPGPSRHLATNLAAVVVP